MYHSLFHDFTSSIHEILYLVILSWVSLSTAKQETDKPICNPAQILKIWKFVITVVIVTGQFAIREGPPPTLKSLESRPPGSIEPHLSPQHPWLDKRATWAVHPSVPAMSGHPSQALDPMSIMIIHLHQHHIQHPHDHHHISPHPVHYRQRNSLWRSRSSRNQEVKDDRHQHCRRFAAARHPVILFYHFQQLLHYIIVITAYSWLVFQNHNRFKSLMGKERLATELSKRCLEGRLLEPTVHYG